MQNLAQVQDGRLVPPIRQDAHADGAKRPEEEKLIIVYDIGCFHQLHIASCCAYKIQSFRYSFPRWPDLKDCSEFNIFSNSYGLFYDE